VTRPKGLRLHNVHGLSFSPKGNSVLIHYNGKREPEIQHRN
jgi:hypothetical protein